MKKKGYKLGGREPFERSKLVALHMRNRIIVFDAHMSEAELRGASSGHLWDQEARDAFVWVPEPR